MRIEDWRRDAGFAVRLLARHPGFTATAVVALGLAIGANTTVFTLANAFLFKNLPFDAADRIVYISSQDQRGAGPRSVSYLDYLALQTQVPSLTDALRRATGSTRTSICSRSGIASTT